MTLDVYLQILLDKKCSLLLGDRMFCKEVKLVESVVVFVHILLIPHPLVQSALQMGWFTC